MKIESNVKANIDDVLIGDAGHSPPEIRGSVRSILVESILTPWLISVSGLHRASNNPAFLDIELLAWRLVQPATAESSI
jgi:hypothetical protein